jgi:hypothetical protein
MLAFFKHWPSAEWNFSFSMYAVSRWRGKQHTSFPDFSLSFDVPVEGVHLKYKPCKRI